jgi:VanZ family protein
MQEAKMGMFVKRWGPALLIMAAIFAASSRPKLGLPDFGDIDLYVKKLGHVCIYAALGWAYARGLTWGSRPSTWRTAALAVVLAGLYGATDEYHQSFVEGRGSNVIDVVIDTVGAVLGVAVTAGLRLRRKGAAGRERKPAGS